MRGYNYTMRILEKEEKIEKLCKGFLLLDEKEQEQVLSVLEGLLFAKLRAENTTLADATIPQKEVKTAV